MRPGSGAPAIDRQLGPLRFLLMALALVLVQLVLAGSVHAATRVKVVYHFVDGLDQATRGLSNIRNHLRTDPEALIVVVANNDGVKFLLTGARDRSGRPYAAAVEALARRGVEFRVCGNTLAAHNVPIEQLLPATTLVQSGVAEVTRLQAKEGYAYLRP